MVDFSKLTLAYHYHKPVAFKDGRIVIPMWADYGKWIDALATRFRRVILLSHTTDEIGDMPYFVRASNVDVVDLGPRDGMLARLRRIPWYRRQVRARAHEFDVVGFELPTTLAVHLAPEMKGKRVFQLIIGYMPGVLKSSRLPLWKKLPVQAYWQWDKYMITRQSERMIVFAGAENSRDEYSGIRDMNIMHTTTLTEADIRPRESVAISGRIEVVCVSRIEPDMGVSVLVDALKDLLDRGVPVRGRIAGPKEGPEYERLAAKVSEWGAIDAIQFVGFVPHGPAFHELLDSSDIMVIPQLENLRGPSRVLWEGMARGLPVLDTESARHESLPDRVALYYVPCGDSTAMANGILDVASNEPLRRVLSDTGIRIARRKTLDGSVDMLLDGLAANWQKVY